MATILSVTFLVAAVFVSQSYGQEGGLGCEISSGLGVADQLNYTVAAADNCTSGVISWHYPMGTLTITFPRTVLPELAHARKKMRLCFRGGMGQGVSSITQILPRRNRIATHEIKIVDSLTEWTCGRPSRRPAGIQVTLNSGSKHSPQYYLKAVHYKVEVVSPKSNMAKGGDRGNRHGTCRSNRQGKGLDNKPGKRRDNRQRKGARQ